MEEERFIVVGINKVYDKKTKLIWTELTLEPITDKDILLERKVIKW